MKPRDREKVQRHLQAKGELMVIGARKFIVAEVNDTDSFLSRQPGTLIRRLRPLASVSVDDSMVMTSNRYQDGLFNGLLVIVCQLMDLMSPYYGTEN